jgi:hypothetical protein
MAVFPSLPVSFAKTYFGVLKFFVSAFSAINAALPSV